jgi:type I restriction enzyme, R subunit
MTTSEQQIEQDLIEKLVDLKYTYRPDIRDRAALEQNFRKQFEALNRVNLTDSEFTPLLEGIVTPDVFSAAKHLRDILSAFLSNHQFDLAVLLNESTVAEAAQ